MIEDNILNFGLRLSSHDICNSMALEKLLSFIAREAGFSAWANDAFNLSFHVRALSSYIDACVGHINNYHWKP